MDSDRHVCPSCGQPVEMVVRRHKTLGAWVPVWVRGPCHNPRCEEYVPRGAPEAVPGTGRGRGGTVTQTGDDKQTVDAGRPGDTEHTTEPGPGAGHDR
ncbi:hypothetical protein ACFYOV_04620 [Streptomyces sp. NPDC005931]|uniref:hypothetical protein n=1 Tax=Streptomyces sp. NPDC005931 TaxID=3364737 RepID=UPI00369D24D1